MKNKIIKNIATSFCILIITLLMSEVLYRYDIGRQNINILMSLAIFLIAAITDGYIYGICSAVIGVFVYDFFITSPRFGFSFTVGIPITLITMLFVVFVSSTIATKMKEQSEHAKEQRELAELLYSINRKLLSSRDLDTIARYAMEYLKNELSCSVAFFEDIQTEGKLNPYFRHAKDDVGIEFFANDKVYSIVRTVDREQKPLEYKEYGCFYPISIQNMNYGVFAFSSKGMELNSKQKLFLSLIVEQTAQALRIYYMTVEQHEAEVMVEAEKVKNSFLRSISHDLRTPLTGIIGSSSTLLEEWDELPTEVCLKLVKGIQNDSQWLLNMIENILSITKVQKDGMVIEKTEEIAEEVIEAAVSTFYKRFPGAQITVKQSKHIIIVPMDIMLISQVLINILENTQKHAKGQRSEVVIEVREMEDFASFIISDNGPGIDVRILPTLFHFPMTSKEPCRDSTRGLGIGLSICKTIINAHGGEIYADNRPEGGAQFMFTLPRCKDA